ncbi:hypothetical protein [Brevundimonas viscosa]|uniref:Uncharacterized protein n=1 Tax=Brevundimonas viscosa TaxID=871741 RepID=A0A1I6SMF6_9CAUL|nr:hypothetical protein [Brevundimonas viscosa]SFS78152.1 hypothetical protein SAMN05192570_2582 [Brevundimonas viscosa]
MSQTFDSYFCIVVTPDEPVADLCVLDAVDDAAALRAASEIAHAWPAARRVEVYRGERPIGVISAATPDASLLEAA